MPAVIAKQGEIRLIEYMEACCHNIQGKLS